MIAIIIQDSGMRGILWRVRHHRCGVISVGVKEAAKKTAVDLNVKSASNGVDFGVIRRSAIRMASCNSAIVRMAKAKTPTSIMHTRLPVLTEGPLLARNQKDFPFGLWAGVCCPGTMACA